MPEMKGVTVKIPADLHAEVKTYLESHDMTMAEFIAQAADHEVHPIIPIKEKKSMEERKRTLAFQVPESLFRRVKDYLKQNNMKQNRFVIGLIEAELEQDEALYQSEQTEEREDEEESDDQAEDEETEEENQDEFAPQEAQEGPNAELEEHPAAQEDAAPVDDFEAGSEEVSQEDDGTEEPGEEEAQETEEVFEDSEVLESDSLDDVEGAEDIELEEAQEDSLEDEESQEDEEAWENLMTGRTLRTRKKNNPSSPAWPGNFVAPTPCIVYTTKQEKGGGTRELHLDAQGHPCCGFDLR